MSLNKVKGNMYNFVTHTGNPIKGKCPHECSYCYMTPMYKQYGWDEKLRLDEKCLKDNLGKDNFIFVGSSTDMFAEKVNSEWINRVLDYCQGFKNKYLFQTKNPKRFTKCYGCFPKETILATTVETNRQDIINKICLNVPTIESRVKSMNKIISLNLCKRMVNIEPIMDFDIKYLLYAIEMTIPFQVNIGADSGHNNLPEPPKEKIEELITELKKFTTVHLKDNLKRLL